MCVCLNPVRGVMVPRYLVKAAITCIESYSCWIGCSPSWRFAHIILDMLAWWTKKIKGPGYRWHSEKHAQKLVFFWNVLLCLDGSMLCTAVLCCSAISFTLRSCRWNVKISEVQPLGHLHICRRETSKAVWAWLSQFHCPNPVFLLVFILLTYLWFCLKHSDNWLYVPRHVKVVIVLTYYCLFLVIEMSYRPLCPMSAIGNAYAVLSNNDKRRQYERLGEERASPSRQGPSAADFEADISPEDLFNMFFGGGFPSSKCILWDWKGRGLEVEFWHTVGFAVKKYI